MLANHVLLVLAAFLAGAVNSVAGGGTLLTFPVLVAALAPQFGVAQAAVFANATSTGALFPGSLASVTAYRRELAATRSWAMILIVPSLIGGGLGAWLLTALPAKTFEVLVPWLILSAAILFAAQPMIARRMQIGKPHAPPHQWAKAGAMCFQFAVAIYGGYFGAGIGILMLSALAMMGLTDIHEMNALKAVLGSAINGVAIVIFVVEQKVHWPFAILMA